MGQMNNRLKFYLTDSALHEVEAGRRGRRPKNSYRKQTHTLNKPTCVVFRRQKNVIQMIFQRKGVQIIVKLDPETSN